MVSIESSTAALHRVGGKQGWYPNVNYSDWSGRERFYVDDWLLFNFDKRYFNVLEVNQTSYDNCNDRGFIQNITRGGRDVFELTEARPYYFLSSGGYCYNGMKVSIDVEVPRAAPAPAPVKNGSPPLIAISIRVLLFLISFAVACFY
ncbi:plastocyanin-like domain-containing family protein [Hibiscus syriacus]|uniref:Plastocyanin-like domain-containing family protein n=2 Tax=Hibiscus syriacus TaxID=106335 RepID=A0A6A2XRV5_HIBSY|nr:plastocyanin-like domain-containing family protein [Hibiscus syriacus]